MWGARFWSSVTHLFLPPRYCSKQNKMVYSPDYVSYLFSGVVLVGGVIGYAKVGEPFDCARFWLVIYLNGYLQIRTLRDICVLVRCNDVGTISGIQLVESWDDLIREVSLPWLLLVVIEGGTVCLAVTLGTGCVRAWTKDLLALAGKMSVATSV